MRAGPTDLHKLTALVCISGGEVPFGWSLYGRPRRGDVQTVMGRMSGSPPGPLSVRYLAWRAGGLAVVDAFFGLVESMFWLRVPPKAPRRLVKRRWRHGRADHLSRHLLLGPQRRRGQDCHGGSEQSGAAGHSSETSRRTRQDASSQAVRKQLESWTRGAPHSQRLGGLRTQAIPHMLVLDRQRLARTSRKGGSETASPEGEHSSPRCGFHISTAGASRRAASVWRWASAFDAPVGVMSHVRDGHGALRACADDIAAAWSGAANVGSLTRAPKAIKRATVLGIRPTETVVVLVMSASALDGIAARWREWLTAEVPFFSQVACVTSVKDPDFFVGPASLGGPCSPSGSLTCAGFSAGSMPSSLVSNLHAATALSVLGHAGPASQPACAQLQNGCLHLSCI